jgi:preprotein translocase subunit SecG
LTTLVLTLHILACLFLIVLVLLQSGKEGMGVIFGGGSSTVFGSSGAGGLLVKLTAILAAVFLVTSIAFNLLSGHRSKAEKSLMDAPLGEVAPAPDKPAAPAGVQIEESKQAAEKPAPGVQIEEKTPAAAAAPQAQPAPAPTEGAKQ